jgi:hypothetical protein
VSQERYYIGPGLKDKLRDVIFRVDSAPHVTSGPRVPYVYTDILPPPAAAVNLRVGTFTGTWSIGSTNVVTISGSSETVRVTNFCVPIETSDSTTQRYSVIFGDVDGTQAAVELRHPYQDTPGLTRGTFSGSWNVGETKSVTLVSNTNSTIAVTNYCLPVAGGEIGTSTSTATVIFGSVHGVQSAIELEAKHMRLGKTQSLWAKGTSATIDLYESGSAGNEAQSGALAPVWNKFADIGQYKWVMVGHGPFNAWYVVSAEC